VPYKEKDEEKRGIFKFSEETDLDIVNTPNNMDKKINNFIDDQSKDPKKPNTNSIHQTKLVTSTNKSRPNTSSTSNKTTTPTNKVAKNNINSFLKGFDSKTKTNNDSVVSTRSKTSTNTKASNSVSTQNNLKKPQTADSVVVKKVEKSVTPRNAPNNPNLSNNTIKPFTQTTTPRSKDLQSKLVEK